MTRLSRLTFATLALGAVAASAVAQDVTEGERAVSRASRAFTVCLGQAAHGDRASATGTLADACRTEEDRLLAAAALAAAAKGASGDAATAEIRQAIAEQREAILAESRTQVAVR
jgi:hypothetical protein